MNREELENCTESAFGDLDPPYFEESFLTRTELALEDALRTDTTRTRRWQELRPLRKYLNGALGIWQLTPKACHYYLPAYLYAMADPANTWVYLSPVLDMLWFEDEDGEPLHNNPDLRAKWGEMASLLTDRQKACIAHFLAEVLKNTTDDPVLMCAEVDMEAGRIEHMLKRYWSAWL
jgi:hypothetical protein